MARTNVSAFQVHTDFDYTPGNCFFDSIAFAFRKHGWIGTGMHVRELLLAMVAEGGPRVQAAVEFWWELRSMRASAVVRKFNPPLDDTQLAQLAKTMHSPSKYWGDDFAISMLADRLRIRIVVLRDGTPSLTQPEGASPTHSIIVALKDAHYVPVSYRGRCVHSVGRHAEFTPRPRNAR